MPTMTMDWMELDFPEKMLSMRTTNKMADNSNSNSPHVFTKMMAMMVVRYCFCGVSNEGAI